ncbi:hypothetical protein [Spiroplasma endosymbiont of Cleonymus obscurus]|uniref:hypothetical protein n=1 Tax=Spiroplasma endosymbiont of Cleonymus obscurus TaxID=3066324 RepID=UPI0037DCCFD0
MLFGEEKYKDDLQKYLKKIKDRNNVKEYLQTLGLKLEELEIKKQNIAKKQASFEFERKQLERYIEESWKSIKKYQR